MAGKDDFMSTAAAEIITGTQLDIRPLQPTIGAEIHGVSIGKRIAVIRKWLPKFVNAA